MNCRWRLGEREKAIASARRAEEEAKGERYVKVGFSSIPYGKLAESLENGEMPDKETFLAWVKEEHAKFMEKRKAEGGGKEGNGRKGVTLILPGG